MRLVPALALAASILAAPPLLLAGEGEDGKDKKEEAGKSAAEAKAKPAGEAKAKPAGETKAADSAVGRRTPRSRKEGLRILEQIVVSVNFDEVVLGDALSHLSAVTGVNMIVGPALRKEGDADAIRVSLSLKKVSARQVLEFLAEGKGLGIGFQSGVLTVTTLQEARGKPVLRLYPVSDITFPLRDFPGPEMELRPAGAEFKVPEETEVKPAFSDPDDVLRLVKDNTGTGTWEDEGVSASVMRDWLVVKQYEEVHEEIARVLALLRGAR